MCQCHLIWDNSQGHQGWHIVKLFIILIIKSLLLVVPLDPSSSIKILSPSKLEIHLSESFSIESNSPLWNLLFKFNRYEGVYRAYLLSSLSQAILELFLGNSRPFAFLPLQKLPFPQRSWYWWTESSPHTPAHLTHLI